MTHATRWQEAHDAVGSGHVCQGRFKSFMVERDDHPLWVLRYVERNAIRAKMVKRAQDWRWSRLHVRQNGPPEMRELLSDRPIDRPQNWTEESNRPQSKAEESAILNAIKRSAPLGGPGWIEDGRAVWSGIHAAQAGKADGLEERCVATGFSK